MSASGGDVPAFERFVRTDGVRVEAIGTAWMAFSPVTGLTVLLNDEAAAILESLDGAPRSARDVIEALVAADADAHATGQAVQALDDAWSTLVDAGLVRRADVG